ncbi:MAG: hypothetical protein JNL21_00115 [Myxococcales bacterium]|nr:hypothetical protein [Myxococcales bacterium]
MHERRGLERGPVLDQARGLRDALAQPAEQATERELVAAQGERRLGNLNRDLAGMGV